MTNLYNEFLKDDKFFKKLDVYRHYSDLIKEISQIYETTEHYNKCIVSFSDEEEPHIAIKKNMHNIENFLIANIAYYPRKNIEILKLFLLLQESFRELEKDCTKEYKERVELTFKLAKLI
jgi:hypothetical protein